MRSKINALLLGCVLSLPLACATEGNVTPTPQLPETVPPNLAVPPGNTLVLKVFARGAQIYACKSEGWTLKAPEADLFDEKGAKVGHHSGGPTWELDDGSAVVGEVKEKAPAEGSIPWLLLAKKSARGQGTLSRVTFVQRLETQGGKAPPDGCDTAHQGAEVRVDYTASYYFWRG
jgi:hypothetical protein